MKFIGKKLIIMIVTILLVSFLVFFSFYFIAGDQATAMLGIQATPEAVLALRQELGLDQPFLVQYGNWLWNMVQGDFGHSYSYNMQVKDLLVEKLPITVCVTLMAMVMVIVISIPISVWVAKHKDGVVDRIVYGWNQFLMAVPPFFMGIMMTYLFGLVLKFFVPGGYISYEKDVIGFLVYLITPAIAMALPKSAMTIKLLRSSMLHELDQDYVRTAYSKGNTTNKVLYGHVLQNALLPVITFLGMVLTEMMVGSIIMEQVFGIPGLGSILLYGINNRDVVLVQGILVCLAVFVVVINSLVDIAYGWIDPRIN